MSIALLYDVHGNLLALNAVLEDAEAAGADSYLLGGDYAAFGPWPRETVERLQLLPRALWIRGNGERWLIDGAGPARNGHELVQNALRTANDALGTSLVTELYALHRAGSAQRDPFLPRLAALRRRKLRPHRATG
jgi:hypothetical protein